MEKKKKERIKSELWIDSGGKRRRLFTERSQAAVSFSEQMWDGDNDHSWKIRRWYRLEVKIALIWNNITFKKERTVHTKELGNPLWLIIKDKMFCPEIITITAPGGSVIAPRWQYRLLNCHCAPRFGRANTLACHESDSPFVCSICLTSFWHTVLTQPNFMWTSMSSLGWITDILQG